jgi:hypothetical protein
MSDLLVLDPLLDDEDAAALVELWHGFGEYGQYSNEGFPTVFAPGLAQRYDAAVNFVRSGGRFGRAAEGTKKLAARTNYFRETYAYGDDIVAPGIEPFLHHDKLMDAARQLHGRPVIVPAIVYANILLPGQELAVHTDVPEFRGANRKIVPQWLLVVMRHSGLFEAWRMPIATAVAYFGGGRGGELAYYPEGAAGPVRTYQPKHNAVVLDTDTVFHGVDRVLGDESPLDRLQIGMRLRPESEPEPDTGNGTWTLLQPDGTAVATFATDDLRYSVSWKAYCFADDEERRAWETHGDDLSLELILDRLADDVGQRPQDDAEFGRLLIDHYVRFPAPAPAPA